MWYIGIRKALTKREKEVFTMASKTAMVSQLERKDKNMRRAVLTMTVLAWVALITGVVLCLINLNEFNDRNLGLMVGIGFLVGSVFIYVIAKSIGLVHTRHEDEGAD
jgi:hypothetical protein